MCFCRWTTSTGASSSQQFILSGGVLVLTVVVKMSSPGRAWWVRQAGRHSVHSSVRPSVRGFQLRVRFVNLQLPTICTFAPPEETTTVSLALSRLRVLISNWPNINETAVVCRQRAFDCKSVVHSYAVRTCNKMCITSSSSLYVVIYMCTKLDHLS